MKIASLNQVFEGTVLKIGDEVDDENGFIINTLAVNIDGKWHQCYGDGYYEDDYEI